MKKQLMNDTYKDCHYYETNEDDFIGCPVSERYEQPNDDPICRDCPYKNKFT